MVKDPVCGMSVMELRIKMDHMGETFYFCSAFCRNLFAKDPERYSRLARAACAPELEKERSIAYFSMEIAVDSRIPTYSGGLGLLAGDTLRSCADLKIPAVGVTLLYEKGYFRQELDDQGNQYEFPVQWNPRDYLRPLSERITVEIEGRSVEVTAWQYDLLGVTGCPLPVIFLDTNLEKNSEFDRSLNLLPLWR